MAFEVDEADAEGLFGWELKVDVFWWRVEVELLPDDGGAFASRD